MSFFNGPQSFNKKLPKASGNVVFGMFSGMWSLLLSLGLRNSVLEIKCCVYHFSKHDSFLVLHFFF